LQSVINKIENKNGILERCKFWFWFLLVHWIGAEFGMTHSRACLNSIQCVLAAELKIDGRFVAVCCVDVSFDSACQQGRCGTDTV